MPSAIKPNMVATYHVGDGPFVSTLVAVGFFGGVGRLLAFFRPFDTGMASRVANPGASGERNRPC